MPYFGSARCFACLSRAAGISRWAALGRRQGADVFVIAPPESSLGRGNDDQPVCQQRIQRSMWRYWRSLPASETILGPHLRGMYLVGSLATGDFDPATATWTSSS